MQSAGPFKHKIPVVNDGRDLVQRHFSFRTDHAS